jgi:hypothetical protein
MEAMWIRFQRNSSRKFAIRPFLGGVNGISGEASIGDMNAVMRRMTSMAPKQDYIVIPNQKWLDGIATRPGIVKQFVATTLTPPRPKARSQLRAKRTGQSNKTGEEDAESKHPIGGTIEWQITGQDTVGGFQLQLIPEYDTDMMSAGTEPDVYEQSGNVHTHSSPKRLKAQFYDVMKTPEELKLLDSDTIHVKCLNTIRESRPKLVGDLLAEAPGKLNKADIVELSIHRPRVKQWKFNTNQEDDHKTIPLEVGAFLRVDEDDTDFVMLQFDEHDEFEEVITYFQDAFDMPNGVLHMKGFTGNVPLVPVHNWGQFRTLRDLLETPPGCRHGPLIGGKWEWDLVLVTIVPEQYLTDALTFARSIPT